MTYKAKVTWPYFQVIVSSQLRPTFNTVPERILCKHKRSSEANVLLSLHRLCRRVIRRPRKGSRFLQKECVCGCMLVILLWPHINTLQEKFCCSITCKTCIHKVALVFFKLAQKLKTLNLLSHYTVVMVSQQTLVYSAHSADTERRQHLCKVT